MRNRLVAVVLLILVALGSGAAWLWGRRPLPAVTGSIELVAEDSDPWGVGPGCTFLLTSTDPLSVGMLRASLRMLPATGFRVEAAGGGGTRFRVIPDGPLEPGKVYRFELAAGEGPVLGWAFPTRAPFRVVGTLPRHQATGVPVHTGIEVQFSHEGFAEVERYFEIEPGAEGRFEVHRRVLVFVPRKLEPATIYTVRVRAGLPLAGSAGRLEEDHIFQFETAPAARDPAQTPAYLYVYPERQEFPRREPPAFSLTYHLAGREGVSLRVTLYRYPGAPEYVEAWRQREDLPVWASHTHSAYREDLSRLQEVARFEATPVPARNLGENLVFPEPLDPGYYAARVELAGIQHQVWFQVTDVASHVIVATDWTLVWVHDLGTGEPLAGAAVTLAGGELIARTDARGLTSFPTMPALTTDARTHFLLVLAEGGEAVVPMQGADWWRADQDRRHDYWRYLYLDRLLYQPEDEVCLFGVIAPREPGARPLEAVTVELWSWRFGPEPVLRQEFPLVDHVFTGSLRLPGLPVGGYTVAVLGEGLRLTCGHLTVERYQKPAYRLEVRSALRAVFAGNELGFTVEAAFFEGTPVPGLSLGYHSTAGAGTLVTDESGRAELVLRRPASRDPWQLEESVHLGVHARLPEIGEIGADQWVRVFHRDLALRVSARGGEAAIELEAGANRVTLERLNAGTATGHDDYLGEAVPGQVLRARLYRIRWEAVERGDYYDFINKVTRKIYDYREERDFLEELRLVTGPDGVARHSLAVEPGHVYLVELETADGRGNPVARGTRAWVGRDSGPLLERSPFFRLEEVGGSRAYAGGETVALRVVDGWTGSPVPGRQSGFLFSLARRGIREWTVSDDPVFTIRFAEEFAPHVHVAGAYFDGREYHPVRWTVWFDHRERELRAAVTTCRPSYRPGDEVRLSLQVTGAGGEPVAATVNLGLVDEALFALRDQRVRFLEALYADFLPSGILWERSSHPPLPYWYRGGEGNGGDERHDFRDAALFTTITTDPTGRAELSFRLPHNLTSWRLTWQAFTPPARAGSGTCLIPVRLPFFADLVVSPTYLAGDRPVVTVRSYGAELGAGERVTFTCTLSREGETVARYERDGEAHRPLDLALPELAEGSHTLTVTARARGGALTDTLTLPFEVVGSYLTRTVVEHLPLRPGVSLPGAPRGLTTVVFADFATGSYLRALYGLRHAGGARLEQALAPILAAALLEEHFGLDTGPVRNFEPANYQPPSGGVAILPYGQADPGLTARVAALRAGGFDSRHLARFLGEVLEDPQVQRDRAVTALWGLAALDEPVLLLVNRLLAEPDLTGEERLYLILASLELGNREAARAALSAFLRQAGQSLGPYLRVRAGPDPEDVTRATALAAIAAARLDLPERDRLFLYVLDNPPGKDLDYLDRLLFLQAVLPRARPEAVGLTYTRAGVETAVELEPGQTRRLVLTPGELAGLTITRVRGEVGAKVSYTAPLDPADVRALAGVTLNRHYEVDGRRVTGVDRGSVITVVLTYTLGELAPQGVYELVDFLPSGLRALDSLRQWGTDPGGWPAAVDGQQVTFFPSRRSGTLRYSARVVSAGDYLAQGAYLRHVSSDAIVALAEPERLGIR